MKQFLLLVALLFGWLPVLAGELEIITLKHRSADEVLPLIRPLLDQDGVASGMNYQLFVRTSPHNLEQIRKLVAQVDVAPRRLKITVIQDVDSATLAKLRELSGSVRVGPHARVVVPGGNQTGGPELEGRRGTDRLTARLQDSRTLENEHRTQQIQVLEGNRALISSGESVPLRQRQIIRHPWGTEVVDSTGYQDVDSGFYVVPRVNGDRVTLEITTRNDALDDRAEHYPTVQRQQASSTVSGRLGEWIEVGVLGRQQHSNDATIAGRSSSGSQEQRHVLIKVDEVN